ncbi:hypothetical protein ES708_28284 [subsurface metagenome]
MKVVKCSDETYAFVCRVAAEKKTYLTDAVDFLVFKQGERIAELEKLTEGQSAVEWAVFCEEAGIKPEAPIAKGIKEALAKYVNLTDRLPEAPVRDTRKAKLIIKS